MHQVKFLSDLDWAREQDIAHIPVWFLSKNTALSLYQYYNVKNAYFQIKNEFIWI